MTHEDLFLRTHLHLRPKSNDRPHTKRPSSTTSTTSTTFAAANQDIGPATVGRCPMEDRGIFRHGGGKPPQSRVDGLE